MNKKIVIGVGILIAAVLALLYFGPLHRNTAFIETAVNEVTGPGCPTGSVFSVAPVDPKDFISITPLGNLNPPDHTIPTDHIYVVIKQDNKIDPSRAKTVRAPGDITITRVSHDTAKKQGAIFSDDYAFNFSPCKQVRLNFGHVNTISQELQTAFENAKPSCDTKIPREGDEYTYCNADMNYAIKTGTVLGTAGSGTSTGLDVQAVDQRSPKLIYANPKRYRDDAFHFVCPLDLFDETTKATLYEKLGSTQTKRTIKPRCGAISQDVPGTAQGNWITGVGANDPMDQPGNWDKSLALVHDNFDPSVGIASIGGVIGNPGQIAFTPTHTGATNREFGEVKPDGSIYCYYSDSQAGSGNIMKSQQLLVQLTSPTSLKAELQTGSCGEQLKITDNATTFER